MPFFFNATATTEIYTLSLHDALPISGEPGLTVRTQAPGVGPSLRIPTPIHAGVSAAQRTCAGRSEEHTSELQSQSNLVCRLLLEKKKKHTISLSVASTSPRMPPEPS